MKLSHIAQALNARIENASPDMEISGVAGIEHAVAGQLTFVHNPKYAAAARSTRASVVIVDEKFAALTTGMLRTNNPHLAWGKAVGLFYQAPRYAAGVHATAVIDASAKLGKHAHVGPYVVIGADAEIGDNAVLLAHVTIYQGAKIGNNFFAHTHATVREFCRLGNNVLLQNGVTVGSDGFGFAKQETGDWYKIVQSGTVVVGDDVEIQAGSCVDRATIGQTTIARGVKIDNLVQVGHASKVGEDTLLCAQVGLAGSTEVGKRVILAGQVGVAGHCKIGDGVVATAQSGIPNDVQEGMMVSGYPAIENRLWLRCSAVFNKLPDLAKAVRKVSDSR